MIERLLQFEVVPDIKFSMFCETCKRSLYDATKDDQVTQMVGEQAAVSHIKSFTELHNVYKVDMTYRGAL